MKKAGFARGAVVLQGKWASCRSPAPPRPISPSKKDSPNIPREELIEPELNVEIGCWYLENSLELYKDSPHPALFALLRYNAGESRANNWLRLALSSPPPAGTAPEQHYLSLVDYPKTRAYVSRILKRYRSRNYPVLAGVCEPDYEIRDSDSDSRLKALPGFTTAL